ncbi:hypothetical protein H4Q26_014114 [Puccinia striiformis f. sp. tritici PST-130]|nr:hypothetical protein H4Q26_014114 [Puccinia striiformis f. sp. tritici PST-130]
MTKLKIVGQYVNTEAIKKNQEAFNRHVQDSNKASEILWKLHPLYSSLLKSTGLLALKSNGYNATDGPFIFPDCGFGIDFKPNTMVLAIFAQRSYIHGTLPPNKPGDLIKVGLSMQIAQKTTKICDRVCCKAEHACW